MPKLPGWQPSISTAMPRKSAALQNAPAMVQPAVQRFVPLNDPGDYIRLGAAKANKYAAIGNAVNTVANVALKVVEEDEAARANNAVAQYSEEMAKWTTATVKDPSLYTEQENPDGSVSKVYHWEDAEERYEEKAKEVQDRLLKDNNFRTQRARLGLERGFTSNDEQFRTKVQGFVANRRVDRGRANDMEALDTYKETGNIEAIEALRNDMIQGGRWNASAAYNVTGAAKQVASYNQTVKQIQQFNDQGAVSALMKEVQAGEGWGKEMTPHQRQQIVAEGHEQLLNIHMGDMQNRYQRGGLPAAMNELNRLSDGGADATGAIDPVSHEKMVGALGRAMNRMASLDQARTAGQESSNMGERYYGDNSTAVDARSITYDMQSKKNKDIVDGYATEFMDQLGPSPEAFYNNPTITNHLMKGARYGYIAKPYMAAITSDIRGGNVMAARKVREVENFYPNAFRSLPPDVDKKIVFLQTHNAMNLAGDPNEMFSKIENMPTVEKDSYEAMGAEVLAKSSPEEMFSASLDRLNVTDGGRGWARDVATANSHSQQIWKRTFNEYLPYTMGDASLSADAATRAVLKSFGNTTVEDEDDPRLEYMSPEIVYQTEGRPVGSPSVDFNNQLDVQLDNLNNHMQASDKTERYSTKTHYRQYWKQDDNGQHIWLMRDKLTGIPASAANGTVRGFVFSPAGMDVQDATVTTNNRHGMAHIQHQEKVAANTSFTAYEFEDAPADPDSGWIADTITLAVDKNEQRWGKLDKDMINFHNELYNTTFNQMVEENKRILGDMPIKQSDVELKVHLFLASRGYLRGDTDNKYDGPPGGY